MYEDGLCEVMHGTYSVTLSVADTDYALLSDEGKREKLLGYSALLDGLDPHTTIQWSILSTPVDKAYFDNNLSYPEPTDTTLKKCQAAFNDKLRPLAVKGFVKQKLLTITVDAPDADTARHYLTERTTIIRNALQGCGTSGFQLNGSQRLLAMQELIRPYNKVGIDYRNLALNNITTKDVIAPASFQWKGIKIPNSKGNMLESPCIFRSGDTYGCVLALYGQGIPAQISDGLIEKIGALPFRTAISLFAQQEELAWAKNKVQSIIADMDSVEASKIRSAAQQGIPDRLATTVRFNNEKKEYETLYEQLTDYNQNYFQSGVFVSTYADDPIILADQVAKLKAEAKQSGFQLETVDYASEDAFNTMLPLGVNFTPYNFGLITIALAYFMPFVAPDLMERNGIWLGKNEKSKNPIFCRMKEMGQNGNGLVIGKSGYGKSFYVKMMLAAFRLVYPDDDTIIIDVEGEYTAFVEALGGEVISLSSGSDHHINPFDITDSYADTGKEAVKNTGYQLESRNSSIIGKKAAFIVNFIQNSLTTPLDPVEISILDLAAKALYKDFIYKFKNGFKKMPVFSDFLHFIDKVSEKNTFFAEHANQLKAKLVVFTEGNLDFFNHITNVNITNKITCFDISSLVGQHRKIGLAILLDFIWNRLTQNRGKFSDTHLVIEEFQNLTTNDAYTAEYFRDFYSRARKYGGYPIAVTQNVAMLLSTEEGRGMVKNAELVVMLHQESDDADVLADMFKLSSDQYKQIVHAPAGHGLIRFSEHLIPFDANLFEKGDKIYDLITTKIADLR